MSTYRNVKAQIAKLEKQAADLYRKEVAQIAAKARALIQEYGLTAEDLGFTGKATKTARKTRIAKATAKPAGVPKYRDPASGKTWTGKGKAPGWIHAGLKQGKSKDDFLIGKKSSASTATVKKVAKPAKASKVVKVTKAAAKPTKITKVKAPATARKAIVKKAAVAVKPAKTVRKLRAKMTAATAPVAASAAAT